MFCEEFQTTLLNEHFKVFDYHKNNSILFIKTNTSGRNGVVRGNKFNKIVKEFIINLHLDAHSFQVFFEKKRIAFYYRNA